MVKDKQPLLTIVLDDINSKPVVHIRGEKVERLKTIECYWDYSVTDCDISTIVEVTHFDKEEKCFKTMKFEMCDLLTGPDTTTEE